MLRLSCGPYEWKSLRCRPPRSRSAEQKDGLSSADLMAWSRATCRRPRPHAYAGHRNYAIWSGYAPVWPSHPVSVDGPLQLPLGGVA
jgi:hypothetical protein